MSCSVCGEACFACAQSVFAERKDQFHARNVRALKALAAKLGLKLVKDSTAILEQDQCTVSSNKAGPAVMGDVSLRARWFYLCISDYYGYLRAARPDDIYGLHFGQNHACREEDIDSVRFVEVIHSLKPKIKRRRKAT